MERLFKKMIANKRRFVRLIAVTAGLASILNPLTARASDSSIISTADDLLNNVYTFHDQPAVILPTFPTWSENPLDDVNWEWRYQTLDFVTTLTDAWQLTSNSNYLNRAKFLLSDWYINNLISAPPRSNFSWSQSSDAVGLRAEVYVNAARLLPDAAWLNDAIVEHGQALADQKFYSGLTNHDLTKSIALIEVGGYLNRSDWLSLGADRINDMAGACVDSQGGNTEQSIYYASLNYSLYENAAQIIEQSGQPLGNNFERVNLMPLFLAHATLPDGTYAMLGDGGCQKALLIEGTPAEYASTQGQAGHKPSQTVAVYAYAGFAFARTGWGETRPFADETMLTLRFGPAREVHGHFDGSSITLYSYGTPLLVDSGMYSYSPSDYRTYFVSREAHNLVTADGATFDPGAPTTREWTRVSPEMFEIETFSKPYVGVLDQRRTTFARQSGYVVVDDRLSGSTSTVYRQLWHLQEDSNPTTSGSRTWTQRPRGNVLIIQLLSANTQTVAGQTSPIQGWLSYEYNVKIPAPVVEAQRTGTSAEFLTLLIPYENTRPTVEVANLTVTDGGYSMSLTINGHTDRLLMNATSSAITSSAINPLN